MGRDDTPLSCKAALVMGIPRDGAISRVGMQTDPLIAGHAEIPVGLEFGYVWVRMKVLDMLLFGMFGPLVLGQWPGGACLNGRARDRAGCRQFDGLWSHRSGGWGQAETQEG
jgi:hypothetical protein